MTKQNESERAEYLVLLSAVREHLQFYREMGLTQLGGYNKVASQIPKSTVEAPETTNETMAKKKTSSSKAALDQQSLFDLNEPTSETARTKADTETLTEIRGEVGNCSSLCPNATNVVFGEGNPHAELMFVGEAPGADEDATGRPFVGRAGQLLDKIIEAIGLKREDVYITNVVKCRPPGNRKPEKDEIEACEPFLFREIEVIKPKVIVALGATPLFSLLRSKEGITKVRGEFQDFHGIPIMPTFHPAFLLRVPERKREVWEDMKKVKAKLQELRAIRM
ncbi:MAG: uracil-DNA glycosylase [Acidobacteriota bacterium]